MEKALGLALRTSSSTYVEIWKQKLAKSKRNEVLKWRESNKLGN